MAITWNTGTTVNDGNSATTSKTVTIPAGVLANDVILLVVTGWASTGVTEVIQASSTGTAPVAVTATQSVSFGGLNLQSRVFYVVAAAADAGKVITVSFVSADTAKFSMALGAWSGVKNSSPVDVSGAATPTAGNGATITCPAETTVIANDWCVELLGMSVGGSAYTGGAGFTQRESVVNAGSGGGAAIFDSNGSVGPAGTSTGGAAFANAGHNNWWTGYTVTLIPASAITLIGQAQVNNSGASPASITYSSTAGNTLILTGHIYNAGGGYNAPTSVTDSAGNLWCVSTTSVNAALTIQSPPLCSQVSATDGAGTRESEWIAWCIGAQAVTSVTIAYGGGVSSFRLITLSEWSGIAQFDNSWANGSQTLSNPSVTTGPVYLTNSGELVVGAVTIAAGSGRGIPAGWTGFTGAVNTQAWDRPGTTGPYSPVWTDTGGGSWAGALAVFSPILTGGGDASPHVPLYVAAMEI